MTHHALRSAISFLESHHVEDARLDAELLLAEACGFSRAHLLAHLEEPISAAAAQRFTECIARRARHEPIAYILGHKEFYGLDLLVDRRVLIPRPETELLVELALERINRTPSPDVVSTSPISQIGRGVTEGRGEGLTIIDVATGSGAVAIALASNLQPPTSNLELIATDISPDALAVARTNAARHGASDFIEFVQSDLLTNVDARANLIVANLPYVARDEWHMLAPDITEYEPSFALEGGADGLDVFRKFFAQAPAHLAPNGAIMLEIGATQAAAMSALARAAFPHATIEVKKDLAGLDRVVVVQT